MSSVALAAVLRRPMAGGRLLRTIASSSSSSSASSSPIGRPVTASIGARIGAPLFPVFGSSLFAKPAGSRGMCSDSPLCDFDPVVGKKLLGKGAILLDVRTLAEFQDGSINGAKNIPFDQIPERMDEVMAMVKDNKQNPVVVFCKSGKRSQSAKIFLVSEGFGSVVNLGGLEEAKEMDSMLKD